MSASAKNTKPQRRSTAGMESSSSAAEAYGVWQEKWLYGKTYWGHARTTFLIDAEDRISNVFENVEAAGHAAEVLRDLNVSR